MQAKPDSSKLRQVVIVDDHSLIGMMLVQVFEALGGYAVVGHAKNAADALKLCQREKPDLVVLDLVLPDSPGLGLLRQVKPLCPSAGILVFSGNLSAPLVRAVLMAGVTGIVGKGAPLEELNAAIQSVAAGRTFLCKQTSETVRLMVHTEPAVAAVATPALSQRERTVLRHLAAGLSSREIAAKLGLSCHTVGNFRSKLSKKTGLHRTAQLSRYAAQIGLVDGPPGT